MTMFIDPGTLRTELGLQARTTAPDGLGGFSESWAEIATVFARVEPVAAESRFGADRAFQTTTHRMTLRHRPGVESGMRFARKDRVFDILTVHDPDESGRYLVCRTREALI